ncbi:MAG: alginate export family protein [Porticoccus sp.]
MKNAVAKNPKTKLAVTIAAVAFGFAGQTFADEALTLEDALKGGKADFSFRYRFENVDDDGRDEEGRASTLKSRFTYTTQTYKDFQVQLEVDNVSRIGSDNYDDFHNSNTDHGVVADTDGTDFNQAWVAYTGIDDTTLKAGRQRINLDNQRFVGGVGWRQNEQTYDGVTIVNTSLADTTAVYAYVQNVERVFGPDDGRAGTPAANSNLETEAHIFNVNYKGLGFGTLSGYAYLLDVDDIPDASTQTFGARFTGSQGDETKFLYTAEYARQSDYKDSTKSFDADYYTLEAGVEAMGVTGKVGYEVLGADDDKGSFSTPLATLHKFQGFADKFLTTPGDGIEDTYASVFTKIMGAKVGVIYHDFEADEGSNDYGDEIDFVVAKQVHKNVHLLFKYAKYDADDYVSMTDARRTDVDKIWLQMTVKF